MSKIIVFNATKQGASHVKKGTVCQDYSLSFQSEEDGIEVAVVCDGHGGDTYVRSDVGSRLAADIALTNILAFVRETPAKLFLGRRGAVTARPKNDDPTLADAPEKKQADLTEIELQQYIQDRQFYQAVADLREQDQCFSLLFGRIYMQWLQAIEQHAREHEFNEHEQTMLGTVYQKWLEEQKEGRQSIGTRIVKAYGSTLMACDDQLHWTEPVPWDCRCFLNLTTSLCDSNPVPEFRYAFSGQGDFPVAVILGSDGLDDSWGNFERLANFYSQTLGIFHDLGAEKAVEELADYLPKLSAKASQDDMSMAGVIDTEILGSAVSIYRKARELRECDANMKELVQKSETVKGELLDARMKSQQASDAAKTAWEERARKYWADEGTLILERMQHRSQAMAEHSDEALEALAKAERGETQGQSEEMNPDAEPASGASPDGNSSDGESSSGAAPGGEPSGEAPADIITNEHDETGTDETL